MRKVSFRTTFQHVLPQLLHRSRRQHRHLALFSLGSYLSGLLRSPTSFRTCSFRSALYVTVVYTSSAKEMLLRRRCPKIVASHSNNTDETQQSRLSFYKFPEAAGFSQSLTYPFQLRRQIPRQVWKANLVAWVTAAEVEEEGYSTEAKEAGC